MKLIVGLGNPEPQYALTRHNAGFWIVHELATTCGAKLDMARDLQACVAKVSLFGQPVVLAKPMTYMNDSGRAVQAIAHWYKIDLADVLVVHDESAIPLGKIRYQHGGGSAGHHGIESIMQMLGGEAGFARLRIGVGPDPGGDRRADYVLAVLPAGDMAMRDKVIKLCLESIQVWLDNGVQAAANKYNGADLRPPPPAPPPAASPEPPAPAPENPA